MIVLHVTYTPRKLPYCTTCPVAPASATGCKDFPETIFWDSFPFWLDGAGALVRLPATFWYNRLRIRPVLHSLSLFDHVANLLFTPLPHTLSLSLGLAVSQPVSQLVVYFAVSPQRHDIAESCINKSQSLRAAFATSFSFSGYCVQLACV